MINLASITFSDTFLHIAIIVTGLMLAFSIGMVIYVTHAMRKRLLLHSKMPRQSQIDTRFAGILLTITFLCLLVYLINAQSSFYGDI